LCCFSTSVCCCLFLYQFSPETFGYTLVFGPERERERERETGREEITGGLTKLHAEELHNFYSSSYIIKGLNQEEWDEQGM
jgi:hypothetical protein